MSEWHSVDFAPQGWQCPICKRVYSPMTPICWYCGNNETIVSTDGTDIYPGYMPLVNEWGRSETVPNKRGKTKDPMWEIEHTNWDNEMRNG